MEIFIAANAHIQARYLFSHTYSNNRKQVGHGCLLAGWTRGRCHLHGHRLGNTFASKNEKSYFNPDTTGVPPGRPEPGKVQKAFWWEVKQVLEFEERRMRLKG